MLGKEIFFSINDDQNRGSLKIENSRKLLTNEEMDFTVIEIKSADKTVNFHSFLEIDEDSIFSDKIKETKYIYSIQYPKGHVVNYSIGTLVNIKDFYLKYTVESVVGSSGSPILNLRNYKLLGIHVGRSQRENIRIGTYIKQIIEKFNDYYLKFNNN